MRITFMTSTGRTGTGFFVRFFNNLVENAWSEHEPKPAFRSRAGNIIKNGHSTYEKYYFKYSRLMMGLGKGDQWFVECNYHLACTIPLLRETFPDSNVIHTIRDGRSIVTSWLNRYRYIQSDHISPFETGDLEAQKHWEQWNPLQKLAWNWKTVNLVAEKNNPDLFLKFEDIFKKDDPSTLFKILDTMPDLKYDKEKAAEQLKVKDNYTRIDFFPKYKDWPELWKEQFWEIAGDTMNHFGYKE